MEQFNTNEKKELYSLFKNIKDSTVNEKLSNYQNSDVLIVDGMNLYLRVFSVIPQLNDNGLHTGGISGFLKSLGYTIRLINPTRCIVVFDGVGGSVRRKKIFPDYKNHRSNKVRLNRIFDEESTVESESRALARQLVRISNYINALPLTVIQLDCVEADDVIAYLSLNSFKESNVTIMSTDKDFYQLINERIRVYSPTKKKLYGMDEVISEYGIHPKNFVLFRMMNGDKSDEIDGVKGCGIKTVIKAFPFLLENKVYSVNDVISYAKSNSNSNKLKIYESVINNENIIRRNYELMQLSESILVSNSQLNIGDLLKIKNKLNRYGFYQMIKEDQIWNAIPNINIWLEETFKNLDGFTV